VKDQNRKKKTRETSKKKTNNEMCKNVNIKTKLFLLLYFSLLRFLVEFLISLFFSDLEALAGFLTNDHHPGTTNLLTKSSIVNKYQNRHRPEMNGSKRSRA